MLSRIVERSYLTMNCKKYLQTKGVCKHFDKIYKKILFVIQ